MAWTLRLLCLSLGLALVAGCAPAAGPAPRAPTAAPAAQTAQTTASAPVTVRIATQKVATDVATFVALERGYFRQEGIDAELVVFGNASEMIPALATDQVDASSVAANPAMWNAVARGIPIKVVLDKGTYRPGHHDQSLVVRKGLYDAGRGRRLEDLRELSIAITPPGQGTSTACALSAALQRVGMSLADLNIQPITFPDMVGALANGAVDTAMLTEPFMTRALRQGTIVRVMGLDEMYPNFTISTMAYSAGLYGNRPAAKGFARAYIRGARDFNAAVQGQTGEADRAQIDEIIARQTGIDVSTVHDMAPPGFNPNGRPNVDSMLYCYQFFRDQGLVPQPVSDSAMAALWGTELLDEVLAEIGRQPES